MKRILICGNFGTGGPTSSGQVIKVKMVSEQIINHFGSEACEQFNTFKRLSSLLTIYLWMLPTMFRYRHAVIFPAQRGVILLIPAFYLARLIYGVKVHYVVIGGWLPNYTKRLGVVKYMLKKYDGIYVETNTMRVSLSEQGLHNVLLMPNFKSLDLINEEDIKKQTEAPFRICTFSRVMRQKGIEMIINAVIDINRGEGETVYELDVYGKVEHGEEEWFERLINVFPSYCQYKGIVPPNQSTKVIKEYFMLVFPTLFFTEGIPGTILDAYASGVPVLSSKWESFADIITEGVTGYGYEFGNYQQLKAFLLDLSKNPSKVDELRLNCLKEAQKYTPEVVMKTLVDKLQQ